jgi:tetratricopeptide (TPR) repeat protein
VNRKQRRAAQGGDSSEIQSLLLKGVEEHRQGRLREAEAIYKRVLARQPKNADALHLAGVAAHQSGRHARAVDLIGKALALNEAVPLYHNNRGLALCALGREAEAVPHFERVVALASDNPEGWVNLGNALDAAGRAEEAQRAGDRALALDADRADAHTLIGGLYARGGDLIAAGRHFERAAALAPDDPVMHANLGNLRAREGDTDSAIAAFRRAAALNAGDAESRIRLGGLLRHAHRPDEAIEALRAGLALNADHVRGWAALAGMLEETGALHEAETAYRRVVALDPEAADAHNDLGNVLRALGRDADAVPCFDAALAARPGLEDAMTNRGIARLALGRFRDGWRDCARRRSTARLRHRLAQDTLPESLAGKRLMVHRDQGLGDEIFFLRFVRALKARGAWIAYRSQSKVAGMVARLDFLDMVIDEGGAGDAAPLPPDIDAEISAGDLPMMLGMETVDDIPPSIAIPLAEGLEDEMRAQLEAAGPPPWIGVTWRAGQQKRDRLSKVAPLEGIAAAIRGTNATLVALQRDPAQDEIGRLEAVAGRPVLDATALNADLERMLALVGLLDDYVCVSNTNVHLRAARGRTSRVLVPLPADYRWMAAGAESPWFPGSPVYREDAAEGWGPALAALSRDMGRG